MLQKQKEVLIMNPNYEVFHIPTLAGADVDDQGHGSIGDAKCDI